MCQLHSVPPFSRHLKSSLRIKIFVSQEWAYFLLRYSAQKTPTLEKAFLLRKSKTPPSPCAIGRGRQLSVPHPSLSPPFAPTRRRLACFVSKLSFKYKASFFVLGFN